VSFPVERFVRSLPETASRRCGGEEVVMQRRIEGSTVRVPVPDHVELRTGTLRSIIRQSGVSRAYFEASP